MFTEKLASRQSLRSAVVEQEARRIEALRQRYPGLDKLVSAVIEQKAKEREGERQRNPQLAAAREQLSEALRSKIRKEERSALRLKRTKIVIETQELSFFKGKTS